MSYISYHPDDSPPVTDLPTRPSGPAMTRISDLVAPLIDRFLESKALFHKFEFEYTPGQYLFSTGKDHRAYSVSQWTAAIKV